jgi:hypothetical protein
MHDPYPHREEAKEKTETLPNDESAGAASSKGSGSADWDAAREPLDDRSEEPKAKIRSSLGLKCDFEDGLDYLGQDVQTVEGLSDQACCELCSRKGDACDVAVMSSDYDEPPRACWLKTRLTKQVQKKGVRACWPPGNRKAIKGGG